jgi:hypothetical protein
MSLPPARKRLRLGFVLHHGVAKLLEIVQAGVPSARLAGALHGGEQKSHQRADDGDHDEQLHEREAATGGSGEWTHGKLLAG